MTSYPGILERRDAQGRSRFRVRVSRNGHKFSATLPTLEAALAWRAQALSAADGTAEPPQPPRPTAHTVKLPAPLGRAVTVEDAARRLVRGMRDRSVRANKGQPYKPSTVRKYEEALRCVVLPRVGAVPISTLTGGECQRLVDGIAAELSSEHAKKALTALRVALKLAQRYGELDANPCARVTVPVSGEAEKPATIISPEEAAAIIERLEADDARLKRSLRRATLRARFRSRSANGRAARASLGAGRPGSGARASCMCAASLDRVRDSSGDYAELAPKSRAGRRDVPLAAEDVARLRRHRLATGRPEDGELVFAGDDDEALSPVPAYRAWKRACRAPLCRGREGQPRCELGQEGDPAAIELGRGRGQARPREGGAPPARLPPRLRNSHARRGLDCARRGGAPRARRRCARHPAIWSRPPGRVGSRRRSSQ